MKLLQDGKFTGVTRFKLKQPVNIGENFEILLTFKITDISATGTLIVVSHRFMVSLYNKNNNTISLVVVQQGTMPRISHINVPSILDYEWHDIKLVKSGNTWTLGCDNSLPVTMTTIPSEYSPSISPIIGGHPSNDKSNLVHVCIKRLVVNGKEYVNLVDDFVVDHGSSFFTESCPDLLEFDKISEELPASSKLQINCQEECRGGVKYRNHANIGTNYNDLTCCARGTLLDKNGGGSAVSCDIGLSSKHVNPLLAIQRSSAAEIQCIYDRNAIDTIHQKDKSIELFKNNNNAVANAFCQSKTTTCPSYLQGGCSRLFSTESDGDYCRQKFNALSDKEKDVWMKNYCIRNNTDDCKCINRTSNDDYNKLKQGNPFSDTCWYIPCANSDNFLVPSEFSKSSSCPNNICQIVYDISQAHNVDIEDNKNDINCNFGGATSGGGGKSSSRFKWFYICLVILFIILLVVYAMK